MKKGEATRARILSAGVAMLATDPERLSVRAVARACGVTHAGVLWHWRSGQAMRDAIAAHAVAVGDVAAVRYLTAIRHPATCT